MRKSHKKALYSIPGWEEFVSKDFKKYFLPFEEAREFSRNLKLNKVSDWQKWSKSSERPDNIPSDLILLIKILVGLDGEIFLVLGIYLVIIESIFLLKMQENLQEI